MASVLKYMGIGLLLIMAMTAFGPLVGLVGGYYCYKRFMASYSTGRKVAWAIGGIALLGVTLHIGTFVTGLLALGALYEIYKTRHRFIDVH